MDKIRKSLRRVSIPIAFIICSLGCLLCALGLTRATVWFTQNNMREIENRYGYELEIIPFSDMMHEEGSYIKSSEQDLLEATIDIMPREEQAFTGMIYHIATGQGLLEQVQVNPVDVKVENIGFLTKTEFAEADQRKYDFFEGLKNIAAILWFTICVCLAALLFYLWKMKRPFRVLNQAIQKISENDLSYQLDYDGQDEFGRLCLAFERMRKELVCNNQRMWNSVEERKRLNAAFAHDLRTPLTVLQGHTDLLLDMLSGENVSDRGSACEKELIDSARAISNQITRLNAFADTMGTLQRLEDYEPFPQKISSLTIVEMVKETATLLFPCGEVEVRFQLKEESLRLDREAFAQICENILSNAARYAKDKIVITLHKESDQLLVTVEDDGIGFSPKDLKNARLAYYRGETNEGGACSHFGLGLYICSLLAEKLNGSLSLDNGEGGGGKVALKICCN